jgi:hypothetical protein
MGTLVLAMYAAFLVKQARKIFMRIERGVSPN